MSDITYNLRDGELKIKDSGTTQKSLTIVLDEGDLSISIPQREVIEVRDRGEIDHVRKGSPQLMSFNFTAKYTGVVGATDTLYDVLTGAGTDWDYTAMTGATYDLADSVDVDMVQLEFTINKPTTPATTEVISIPNVPLPALTISEGNDYNTIAASGTSHQELPIVTST